MLTLLFAGGIRPSVAANWLLRAPSRFFRIAAAPRVYTLEALTMPFVGDWSDVDSGERVPLSIDFAAQLPQGDTITGTPTVVVAAYFGADPNAAALAYGPPALSGTIVTQFVGTAFVPGVVYRVSMSVATTSGAILTPYAHIAANAPN